MYVQKNRHTGGITSCFCENIEENLIHFILFCPEYDEERTKLIELQRPYIEDNTEIVGRLLFEDRNIDKKKEMILQMWKKREKRIKEISNQH